MTFQHKVILIIICINNDYLKTLKISKLIDLERERFIENVKAFLGDTNKAKKYFVIVP